MSEQENHNAIDNFEKSEDRVKFFKEAAQKLTKESTISETKEEIKQEKVLTEVEQEAVKLGWDPTGESAKKVGKRALSAEEFVDRQSFYVKIDELKKEVHRQKEFTRKQAEITKQATEQAYKQALEDFNRQKLEAVSVGDIKGFQTIEAKVLNTQQKLIDLEKNVKMDDEEQVQTLSSTTGQQQSLPKETIEFAERNKQWFNTHTPLNTAMGNFAAGIDAQIEASHPQLSLKDRYLMVEEEVRKTFPQQFINTKQEAPSVVSTSNIKGDVETSSKVSVKDLSPQQRSFGEHFIAKGLYKNLTEYAQVLHKNGQFLRGADR